MKKVTLHTFRSGYVGHTKPQKSEVEPMKEKLYPQFVEPEATEAGDLQALEANWKDFPGLLPAEIRALLFRATGVAGGGESEMLLPAGVE